MHVGNMTRRMTMLTLWLTAACLAAACPDQPSVTDDPDTTDPSQIVIVRTDPVAPTSRDDVEARLDPPGEFEGEWTSPGEEPFEGAVLPADRTTKGQEWTITARSEGVVLGEASVVIRNAPPICLEAQIAPFEGTVQTTWSCVCADRDEPDDDPNLDACTFHIDAFRIDSEPVDAAGCTLEAGEAAAGQQVECTLTPSDEEASGSAVDAAAVTVGNSAPSGGTVTTNPAAPREGDVLVCEASGATDPDGDPVQWQLEWLRDGAVIASTDTITGNLFDKGESLTCRARPIDGGQHSDGEAQGPSITSAPVVIANTPPQVSSAAIEPEQASRLDTLVCTAEGMTDADPADSPSLVVAWIVGDEVVGTGASLAGTDLAVGAEVICEAAAWDGEEEGAAVESAPATVIDLPPVCEGAEILPASPGAGATLSCDAIGLLDPEDDPLTLTYVWHRNGSTLTDQTQSTLQGVFVAGDVIDCQLTPADPWVSGATVTAPEVSVVNSPPSMGAVELDPAEPSPCTDLTCTVSALADPDSLSGVEVQWRWEVDDQSVAETGATLAAPPPGSVVRCFALATDPAGGSSVEVGSDPATVTNQPPTFASASVTPPDPVVGDLLTCTGQGYEDPDCGAPPVWTAVWTAAGETITTPELDTSGLQEGAEVTCQLSVSDGWESGAPQPVTVALGAPPQDAPPVSISAPGGASGVITCVAAEPVDGATFTWWIGAAGEPFAGEASLDAGAASDCDTVQCRLTMPDGAESNTAQLNLPPGPACDDGEVCTEAFCDGDEGCAQASVPGPCDDGDLCTGPDQCAGGICGGAPASCDDGSPCTGLGCDPASGCTYGATTASCSDGSTCTVDDTCSGGTCQPGALVVCDDDDPCTTDSCDPVSGCLASASGDDCDDGSPCTVGDTCGAEGCLGEPVNGNPPCGEGPDAGWCGEGVCHANQAPDKPAPHIEPEEPVTGQTLACSAGEVDDPDDWPLPVELTFEWRDGGVPIDGQTSPTLPGDLVAKGATLTCVVTASDGMADSSPGSVSVVVGNAKPHVAGATVLAADGGPPHAAADLRCVADASDPDQLDTLTVSATWWANDQPVVGGSGDLLPAAAVTACEIMRCQATVSDGLASASAESLDVQLPELPGCGEDTGCMAWTCTPAGACQGTLVEGACDDGDPCTQAGTCQDGVCVAPPLPADACDAVSSCVLGSCESGVGCVETPVIGPCDDGSVCTVDDTCAGSVCVGQPVDCSDGIACTSDACDAEGGCADVLPADDVTFPIVFLASPDEPEIAAEDEGPTELFVGTQGGMHSEISLRLDLPPAIDWTPASARVEITVRKPCCNGTVIGSRLINSQPLTLLSSGDYLADSALWFVTASGVTDGDTACQDVVVRVWNQTKTSFVIESRQRHVVTLTGP